MLFTCCLLLPARTVLLFVFRPLVHPLFTDLRVTHPICFSFLLLLLFHFFLSSLFLIQFCFLSSSWSSISLCPPSSSPNFVFCPPLDLPFHHVLLHYSSLFFSVLLPLLLYFPYLPTRWSLSVFPDLIIFARFYLLKIFIEWFYKGINFLEYR